jgi:hypothetical protein
LILKGLLTVDNFINKLSNELMKLEFEREKKIYPLKYEKIPVKLSFKYAKRANICFLSKKIAIEKKRSKKIIKIISSLSVLTFLTLTYFATN